MIPYPLRALIGRPVLVWKQRLYRRFLRQLQATAAVQEDRLRRIVAASAASDFGRRHGLASVRSAADLRSALPVQGYDAFAPWIQRVMDGETTALFNPGTGIAMYAMTSGTTAAAKHIPVTAATLREYKESWTIWGVALAADHPRVPYGGVINLASSWRTTATATGTPCGSISGLLFEVMHGLLRLLHAVPPEVALVKDPALRTYLAIRLAMARPDVGMITTANPSTLISLARRLEEWAPDLLRDLADGTLRRRADYPREALAGVAPLLRRRHVRTARAIEARISAHGGQVAPTAFWPELALLGVWTGGSLAAYLPGLRRHYGPIALRDHGLSASEGRITIPLLDSPVAGGSDGALYVNGPFFEFIPETAYGAASPEVRLAHELDTGGRYYLVMTTSGGLFRYDIGDLVECTGHIGSAPTLRFLNKSSQFANLTGEKLSVVQVTSAVTAAATALGLSLDEWTMVPVFGDPPCYQLWVEREAEPPPAVRGDLERGVDAGLIDRNIEYADKRRSGRLGPPVIRTVAPGFFAHWRAERLATSGAAPEQYKHPFLVGDPAFSGRIASWRRSS